MTLTVGSLFAGIGGLDLGLERAGMRVEWQVEIDPFCQKVLAKHWPAVARYGDILECGAHNLTPVDVLCGGFMCTDISNIGKRAGIIGDTRSGITWRNFYRIICELRPRYVIVENVAVLVNRGIDTVLGSLAEVGYDAEWQVLSACMFGATHMRQRLFIVAYPTLRGCDGRRGYSIFPSAQPQEYARHGNRDLWERQAQPCPVGILDGIPDRVDRIRGLGNAVVPQVAEYIGGLIINYDSHST